MTAMAVSTGVLVRAVRHGCALRADAVTTFKIQKRSKRNTTINDTKKYSGTSILYKSVELARDSLR